MLSVLPVVVSSNPNAEFLKEYGVCCCTLFRKVSTKFQYLKLTSKSSLTGKAAKDAALENDLQIKNWPISKTDPTNIHIKLKFFHH